MTLVAHLRVDCRLTNNEWDWDEAERGMAVKLDQFLEKHPGERHITTKFVDSVYYEDPAHISLAVVIVV